MLEMKSRAWAYMQKGHYLLEWPLSAGNFWLKKILKHTPSSWSWSCRIKATVKLVGLFYSLLGLFQGLFWRVWCTQTSTKATTFVGLSLGLFWPSWSVSRSILISIVHHFSWTVSRSLFTLVGLFLGLFWRLRRMLHSGEHRKQITECDWQLTEVNARGGKKNTSLKKKITECDSWQRWTLEGGKKNTSCENLWSSVELTRPSATLVREMSISWHLV